MAIFLPIYVAKVLSYYELLTFSHECCIIQPDSDIQRETYGYYSGQARVVHLERGEL